MLIQRAGQIVTRQELAEQVWGSQTFVDYEQGLNYAIRQIRTALEDDAEHPRFLETLPKRGYRFIAQMEGRNRRQAQASSGPMVAKSLVLRNHSRRLVVGSVVVLVMAVALVIGIGLRHRTAAAVNGHPISSIAVLPLRNLSPDPQEEYFSDGMTDELITDLAKSPSLRVISHTSVERYKGTKRPLPDIARELGVEAIIEGSVLRSNNRVRVTAQLIDARSDEHLWAESYERDVRDVLPLQDELARRIAKAVGIKLTGSRQSPNLSGRTANATAYEAYLKGNFYWNRLTCDGFKRASEYFRQSADQDPSFALAYVGLAESDFTLLDWGCSPDSTLMVRSKAAALKALELDSDLAAAHAWLGKIAFFYEWDWPEAERQLQQALELDPKNVHAHLVNAVFLVAKGKKAQGYSEIRSALELDPTSEVTNVVSTFVLYIAHDFDRAIEQGQRTVELYPESPAPYIWLGAAYESKGMDDRAVSSYLKMKSLSGMSANDVAAFRTAYAKSGIRGYWMRELQHAKQTGTTACWTAVIYSHIGDKEKTLEFLNQAFQQHCSGLHVLNVDPRFDAFRDDARFTELLHWLRM